MSVGSAKGGRATPGAAGPRSVGPWRRRAGVLLLGGLLAAWGVGVWLTPSDFEVVSGPEGPPDVVIITLDTTRADRLGSYGYGQASTPTLDRLAAAGVRFERALSPVPLTLPAHASLLTGRYPFAHGVRNNGHYTLPDDVPTLAERFHAAGYDTAAFVSAFVLDRQFGLVRGFDHYDDTLDAPSSTSATPLELERRGDRTVQAALEWLETRRARQTAAVVSGTSTPGVPRKPLFLWVHFYDPHEPYVAPTPFADRVAGRAYDAEVAFVDAAVGELLGGIDRIDIDARDRLVVVAGDHGESLGEHGESAHGMFVYEGAIRVPLLVSWPGHLAPRVVRTAVSLVDVAPTIAALTGLPAFVDVDGHDVAPLMRAGDEAMSHAPAYAETYFPEFFMGWSPLRAIDTGRWKYIDSPEPELYDVIADPGETINRVTSEPASARALRRQLEETVRAANRSAATPLSTDAQRKLLALGYVGLPPRLVGGVPQAPARMIGLFERLTAGNRALAEGRAGDAARVARDVLREDPDNPFAHLVLGRALLAAGDATGAAEALTTYLRSVPASADAHHWLALASLQRGDRARALAEEEAALTIDPRHGAAIALRAGLLFSAGKRDEGIAALAAAVAAQPTNPTLRVDYAELLADAGRLADAEAQYRRVLDRRADDTRARAGLGMLLAKSGRLAAAIAELSRVLDVDPKHEEARIERAAAYARSGRPDESRADLERLTGPEVRPDIRRTARRQLGRPE